MGDFTKIFKYAAKLIFIFLMLNTEYTGYWIVEKNSTTGLVWKQFLNERIIT